MLVDQTYIRNDLKGPAKLSRLLHEKRKVAEERRKVEEYEKQFDGLPEVYNCSVGDKLNDVDCRYAFSNNANGRHRHVFIIARNLRATIQNTKTMSKKSFVVGEKYKLGGTVIWGGYGYVAITKAKIT